MANANTYQCRTTRLRGMLAAAIPVTIAFAPIATAAVILVPHDHATIQQTIDAARDGDESVVEPPANAGNASACAAEQSRSAAPP